MFLNVAKCHYKASKLANNGHKKIASIINVLSNVLNSCDIPYTTKIGKNVKFAHRGIGVVINKNAIIGDDCWIFHNVTIGGRGGNHDNSQPIVGDNVMIGCNSVILGGVKIGSNVIIGAGSVVISDIPDGATVVGVPAKVIKNKNTK